MTTAHSAHSVPSCPIEEYEPPEALRQALAHKSDDLKMLPDLAKDAMEMAKNPDCNISKFATLVRRDMKLTTEMLSIANSAALGGRGNISSLQDAIVRLGLTQCRNLIMSSSVASLVKQLPSQNSWIRETLWKHAFTTAVACMYIDRGMRLDFQDEAFTAGLLHDFGRTLLAIACPDNFQIADPMDFREDAGLLQQERETLGSDHCVFGAWFAAQNQLSSQLISAIRWHHHPDHKHEHQTLAALVAAGDHVANHLQRCSSASGYDPAENVAIDVLADVVRPSIRDQFHETAPALIEHVSQMAAEGVKV